MGLSPLLGQVPAPATQPLIRRKSSGIGEGPAGRRTRGTDSVSGAIRSTKPREGPPAWLLLVGTQRIPGTKSHANPSVAMRLQT